MPGSIDPAAKKKRRQGAWQSAAAATALRLAIAGVLLWLRLSLDPAGFLAKALLVCAVLDLGTVVPVWILLKQRLKEIEGGEEDAAAQY